MDGPRTLVAQKRLTEQEWMAPEHLSKSGWPQNSSPEHFDAVPMTQYRYYI